MWLNDIILVIGTACEVFAVLMVLWRWRRYASLPAYIGLVLLHVSTYIYLPTRTFVFWGICTLIVLMLCRMLPKGEPEGRKSGGLLIGVSSLAGCLLGILVGARVMVLGVIVGAVVGTIAYGRSPEGGWIMSSHKTALSYFCSQALPIVVAVSEVGIAVEGFIF